MCGLLARHLLPLYMYVYLYKKTTFNVLQTPQPPSFFPHLRLRRRRRRRIHRRQPD